MISVIIPCYNSEEYLDDCYQSLTIQDCKNVEFIFIDDGSQDNTLKMLEDYSEKDSRVKYITHENRGLKQARLSGIEIANGEFIGFLDSDDMLSPNAISDVLKVFTNNIQCDGVIYDFTYLKNKEISHFQYSSKKWPINGKEAFSMTLPNWTISGMGVFRKNIILEVYSMDLGLSTNADEIATRLIFEKCNEVDKVNAQYIYRIYNESTSNGMKSSLVTRLDTAKYMYDNFNVVNQYMNSKTMAYINYLNEWIGLHMRYADAKHRLNKSEFTRWNEIMWDHGINILMQSLKVASKSPLSMFSPKFKVIIKIPYLLINLVKYKIGVFYGK